MFTVPEPSPRKTLVSTAQIMTLVSEIFGGTFHAKRCRSIGNAVLGTIYADSLSIHDIGRGMARALNLNAKHAIKQFDRFLSNKGVEPDSAFRGWVPWVVGQRKEIVVAMDWTEYGDDGHSRIAIYLVTEHGRATPLVWKTVRTDALKDHRNEYEAEALDMLKLAVPKGVRVTVLADRGFGDHSLYEYLDTVSRFDYVIRFRQCIKVRDAKGNVAPARNWVLADHTPRRIDGASVTGKRYRVGGVVVVHDRNMKEAWCLATSRPDAAVEIVNLYSKRFTCEETFRDEKDSNFGMGLLNTHIDDPARRDRLLLVFAIAFSLLTLIGHAGEQIGADRVIKANTSARRQHSLFRQGREYVRGALEAHRYADLRSEFRNVLEERRAATLGII